MGEAGLDVWQVRVEEDEVCETTGPFKPLAHPLDVAGQLKCDGQPAQASPTECFVRAPFLGRRSDPSGARFPSFGAARRLPQSAMVKPISASAITPSIGTIHLIRENSYACLNRRFQIFCDLRSSHLKPKKCVRGILFFTHI
jgi:hypothetical protein